MDVRIIHLEPLHVASVLGYGTQPESIAWNKLVAWAEAHQQPLSSRRVFGFNNPSPTPGSPNYGYEFWMTVGDDMKSDDTITVKNFPGGDYAVTRCTGAEHITETWMQLSTWAETSPYQTATHQWLEEHIKIDLDLAPDSLVLDLYLPIKG